jgi:FixJ family two-component response regulator
LASLDSAAGRRRVVVLSERERAVIVGLVARRSRRQIARTLGLNRWTVDRTLSELDAKLDAPTLF